MDTRQHDPSAPDIGDHHGDGKERAIVVDLMHRLNAFCENRGMHTHPVATEDEQGRVRSRSITHHHHDLRCLVEAGRNQVLPDLKKAEARATRWMARSQRRQAALLRSQEETRAAQARIVAKQATLDQVWVFMESMPAVGPWATVMDQFTAWQDEQAEEQA